MGVVTLSSELSQPADLLTANLSALPDVVVVERGQFQRVMQEQALALSQPQSWIKAGRLLGADGVILIEKRTRTPKDLLSVRVVAVGPGVVVMENEFDLPVASPSAWASNYAARLQRTMPRLAVRREAATSVSIGSLRSSVATGEAGLLEAELTALLRVRLAQEPSVFMLERRSMEALQTEKELGAVEESFWNGAVIVDGTIDRDLVSRTNVTIHARIAAPRQPATEVVVSGSREALPSVINDLTAKILTSLGKKGALPAWQTEAEAEKFLQEAQWAANWGLWPQVANYADTSWALGKRVPLVGAYRVTGRAWHCLGLRGPASYEYVGPYGFRPPPHPEIMPTLMRAMEIYRESFPDFASATNAFRTGWASLGLDLLLVNARVLDRFQERPELCESREGELREVRALGRELNMLLLTNSGLGLAGWRRDLQGLPTVFGVMREGPVSTLVEAWFDAGGVWFEEPADALALYRKLSGFNYSPQLRERLFKGIPLAAWTVRDRLRTREMWCGFVREMTVSTNVQTRIDGWRALLVQSEDTAVLGTAGEQMLEEAARNRALIFNHALNAPVSLVLSDTLRRIARWGVPEVEQRLQTLRTLADTRLNENDPDFSYAIWKNFVERLGDTNNRTMSFRRPPVAPAPEQVSELIAELEKMEREKRTRWPVRQYVEGLQAYAPPVAPATPAQSPVAVATSRGTAAAGALEFSRAWHLGQVLFPPDRTADPSFYREPFRKATWQEGNLWLEVQTYGTAHQGASPKLATIRLDPLSMQSEVIVHPFESFVPPVDYRGHSLVVSNQLFVAGPGAMWRQEADGAWKKFPLPAELGAVPYRWGRHIALSALGTILDFDPETGEARILASTRRNPPASALDSQALGVARLAVWPDNTLCANVGGQVWRYDLGAKDWRVFASATNCGQSLEIQSQGVFLRQAGRSSIPTGPQTFTTMSCGPQLLGGWRPNRSVIDYYTWAPARSSVRAQAELYTPPRWPHPPGSFPHDCQAQFDGANVWVFPAPFALAHFEMELPVTEQWGRTRPGTNYIPSNILFLDGTRNETVELPIRFTGQARELADAYEEHHAQGRNHVEFIHTEKGLAIVVIPEGVIFWASRQAVEAALAAARSRALPGYAMPVPGSARFDKEGKGWLIDSENRALRHDPAVIKEQAQKHETAVDAAIRRNGPEWDKLFTQIDRNHDGKLTGVEMDLAAKDQSEVFARRFVGLNGSVAQVFRPFNKDKDLGLDQKEFRLFMAEPRPLAELNRSTDWLKDFGLKPEQIDRNDDGIMDAAERASLLRLLREQPPK